MANIDSLQGLVNTYGIAVRAGVITPSIEDEIYFREIMDLPDISAGAVASWKETDGIRKPITLVQEGGSQVSPASPTKQQAKPQEAKPNE